VSTDRLFLTFTALADPGYHREYNAWHQLDHLPENLLLPGIAWGDRWVRSPDLADLAHVGDPSYAEVQYAVAYGFRAPAEESVAAWTALNQRALWWGRRPELGWTARMPVGFFEPVKSYAAARVLVAPEAVPLRPHRGVHLTLSRLAEPGAPCGVSAMAAHDRERVPALLGLPGVAGVGTFRFGAGAAAFGGNGDADPQGLVLKVVWCDEDPAETASRIEDTDADWVGRDSAAGDVEHVLFSGPLATISPWQWDWFEA
jgi:hypothetical protein